MRYATVEDVEAGFRPLSDDEKTLCDELLDEAGVVIDAYNQDAETERKQLVSCRMVRRQLDAGPGGRPERRDLPHGCLPGVGLGAGLLPDLDDVRRLGGANSTSPNWKRSCWASATRSAPAALWRT